jgi:hypothetical protein
VAAELARQAGARREVEGAAAAALARRQRAAAELSACAQDLEAAKAEKGELLARVQALLARPGSSAAEPPLGGQRGVRQGGGAATRARTDEQQQQPPPPQQDERPRRTPVLAPAPIDPSADTFEI